MSVNLKEILTFVVYTPQIGGILDIFVGDTNISHRLLKNNGELL